MVSITTLLTTLAALATAVAAGPAPRNTLIHNIRDNCPARYYVARRWYECRESKVQECTFCCSNGFNLGEVMSDLCEAVPTGYGGGDIVCAEDTLAFHCHDKILPVAPENGGEEEEGEESEEGEEGEEGEDGEEGEGDNM
jgi:hypothetical protein